MDLEGSWGKDGDVVTEVTKKREESERKRRRVLRGKGGGEEGRKRNIYNIWARR